MPDLSGYDTMTLRDARKLYMYIEKKEILDGYTFPSKPGKDGYYRIYVSDSTKKSGRRQLFAKSLDELKDKVYHYERGINGVARKTFKDVFELALEEKLKYIKDPEKLLSRQNTIKKYKSDYKRFIANTGFEDMHIDCITKKDIEEIFLLNLKRYDIHLKAMNALKGIFRITFSLAYENYWITDNVFTRMNFDKYKDMLVPSTDIKDRVHAKDEVSKFLEFIHEKQRKNPDYIPAYALEMQILTGARRGEIPPLRRSDIHDGFVEFCREQITVRRFNDIPEHFTIVNHTKTYRNRRFPVSEDLREFLNRLYVVLDTYYPDTEFLFPAENANGVISNNAVYFFYRRICRNLGIELDHDAMKGTHSFRRNAITDVINSTGGNTILAASLFGNSPIVAATNYYTGIDTKAALEALNNRDIS